MIGPTDFSIMNNYPPPKKFFDNIYSARYGQNVHLQNQHTHIQNSQQQISFNFLEPEFYI